MSIRQPKFRGSSTTTSLRQSKCCFPWHGLRYQLPILQVLDNGHSQLVMQPCLHDKKQAPIFFSLVSNERKAREEICSPCCSHRLRLSSDEQPSALCTYGHLRETLACYLTVPTAGHKRKHSAHKADIGGRAVLIPISAE